MTSSRPRRRILGWDEQNAYSGWRKVVAYVQREGVRKRIKKRTHRRERREGKIDLSNVLREELDE